MNSCSSLCWKLSTSGSSSVVASGSSPNSKPSLRMSGDASITSFLKQKHISTPFTTFHTLSIAKLEDNVLGSVRPSVRLSVHLRSHGWTAWHTTLKVKAPMLGSDIYTNNGNLISFLVLVNYLTYGYITPDYNSPLIYWWGYCNLSIWYVGWPWLGWDCRSRS